MDGEFLEGNDKPADTKEWAYYTSIENSYQEKVMAEVVAEKLTEGEWIVTEKIHGSNFAFVTDGKDIKAAKRNALIEDQSSFFGHREILKRLGPAILRAHAIVKKERPALEWLRIYGEIFGGQYPSKEVAAVKNASVVQRGIWYCPQNDFYAFDIHDGSGFLEFDAAEAIFKECGFFYARALFRGSLADALKYPSTFVTTIPLLYKLPALPDNIAEGVVIRPAEEKKLSNGSRVIFKNKTDKFSEKTTGLKQEKKAPTEGPKLSEAAEKLDDEMAAMTNAVRLASVLSKFGEATQADIGKLINLLTKDVNEEFNKDHAAAFKALPAAEQKVIVGRQAKRSAEVVKAHFAAPKP